MEDPRPSPSAEIPMRPCPRCGEPINSLKMYSPSESIYAPSIELIHDVKTLTWEMTESVDREDAPPDFECPVCSEVLFTDQEAADVWLLSPRAVRVPLLTDKFYNVIRISRTDVAQAFDEHPHLAEAAAFLQDFEMEHLASKIANALMDGGDYHIGIECWSEGVLDETYIKNREAILERIKADLDACPECGVGPSCIPEKEYLREHGLCETCRMEDSEKQGVENAIKNTADPREIEAQQERTDAAMDMADEQELDRKFCVDEPPEEDPGEK